MKDAWIRNEVPALLLLGKGEGDEVLPEVQRLPRSFNSGYNGGQ